MNTQDNTKLQELLDQFCTDLKNVDFNLDLANFYYIEGIYASCITHLLNVLTYTEDINIIYETHLKISLCLAKLGDLEHSELYHIYLAHSLMLKRCESYQILVYFYAHRNKWAEALTYVREALDNATFNTNKKIIDVYLDNKDFLKFYEVVCLYRLGLENESKEKAYKLYFYDNLQESQYCLLVEFMLANNMIETASPNADYSVMTLKNQYNNKLQNIKHIKTNYSQIYQDLFVLHCLGSDYKGVYLELGSGHFYKGSNTFLLEKLGWKGMSIDINEEDIELFRRHRSNLSIQGNILDLDLGYILNTTFKDTDVIDYLQVDCDKNNLDVLYRVPFNAFKFKIITFEHDHYIDCTREIRKHSRDFLNSLGYKLVVPNVTIGEGFPFEDWYVHPDYVNFESLDIYKYIKEDENKVGLIFKP